MSIRKTLGVAVVGTLTASGLWLGGAPSQAVVVNGPWDPTFTPVNADLIGVGSDTSQEVVINVAEAFNAGQSDGSFRVASFGAAVQNGVPLNGCDDLTNHPENCQITLPVSGTVNRPNGSGAGKSRLFGAGQVGDIDFARASSSLSDTEIAAGLQQLPFAVDTMGMAVSNNVASHAPASLTIEQILDIYQGDITNWNQVGGTNGVIKPILPQSGSGTFSFFDGQLKAANGGVTVVYTGAVVRAQEHDDTLIKSDPDAIAPFSIGRAGLLGSTLKIEGGWTKQRALYNVFRGAHVTLARTQEVFGSDGFFCSDAATQIIEDSGFEQLARPADGGVCGLQTQTATSNFTVNEPAVPVATATTVTGTSTGAGKARLTATVASTPTAEGTVTFLEGGTELAADVALIGGTATVDLTGLVPGVHNIEADFTPTAGTGFIASEDTGSVTVKAASRISETFPDTVRKDKQATGTITVTLLNTAQKATGRVKVLKNGNVLKSGLLVDGKVTLTLPELPKGLNRLVIKWPGSKFGVAATKRFTITQN